MKSQLLQLRHSPLRLAILIGFVGLEIIDLAETFALHVVEPPALARIHTVTAFLSLAIVVVCVFLLSAPEPTHDRPTGRDSTGRRDGDFHDSTRTPTPEDVRFVRHNDKTLSATDPFLEEQVLSLP